MKYVLTDHNKMAIGSGTHHSELARALSGNVTGAGHFELKTEFDKASGSRYTYVQVYGGSAGYGCKAKAEDAEDLSKYFRLDYIPSKAIGPDRD